MTVKHFLMIERTKLKMSKKTIEKQINSYRSVFEEYIFNTLHKRKINVPVNLFEAMEYSLTAGGKRIRPILCLAAAENCGCSLKNALPMALGIEMLHTATLIHDDLPSMDNDDMRRGKATNHKRFGEPLAILAGDALLVQSIEYPLKNLINIKSENILEAMKIFTSAIGATGVCGGQTLDMHYTNEIIETHVKNIARLKTAVLISASLQTGAVLGTSNKKTISCYKNYGLHLGTAFQIVDDILDVVGTKENLGKTQGKDAEQGKITYVSVFGLETARQIAEKESLLATKSLDKLSLPNDFLIQLPEFLIERIN